MTVSRETEKTAVLLVNVGTPSQPAAEEVRQFLKEFLSDPYVVRLPRWFWLPLLNGVILPFRTKSAALRYQKIWTDEGSPLLIHTRAQARLVNEHLAEGTVVREAMIYGKPSIIQVLQELFELGVGQTVVIPMFPQCSWVTTGPIRRILAATPLKTRLLPDFHAHSGYIDALAALVSEFWEKNGRAERLVLTFHGLPKKATDSGDPYQRQCLHSAALLAERLALKDEDFLVSFQSRFGFGKWLTPYTDQSLIGLARSGVSSVDVLCPGFCCDCLETLEEIAIAARASFLENGGKKFNYIPPLNERPEFIAFLAKLASEGTSPGVSVCCQ